NYHGIQINSVTANITDNDSANNPPVVVNGISDLTSTVSTLFNFTFPADTFNDPDGNPLSYSATLEDGSELPNWLIFDTTTRTFSGTPLENHLGSINIKVTASDGSLSVNDIFTLEVNAVTPNPDVEGEESSESDANNPESEVNNPESETNNPESETNNPESEVNNPESETNNPESETHPPELSETPPESETNNPESETNNPESETNNPESETNNPESETNNPELSENPPESETHPPESETHPPQLSDNPPESETHPPQLSDNPPESETHPSEFSDNPPESETNPPESETNPPESETNPSEWVEPSLKINNIGPIQYQKIGPTGPAYFKKILATLEETSSYQIDLSDIFEWISTLEELSYPTLSSSNLSQLGFTAEGSYPDNCLISTPDSDFIQTIAGDNFIQGLGGNESLFGGEGNDIIQGNQGDDFIQSGYGTNWIHGGEGEDTIVGGPGVDVLYGNDGNDLIYAWGGNNFLYGNQGNDTLIGGDCHDVLYGGKGDDLLIGGDGEDWLFGDLGNDILIGGAGQDRFIIRKGAGVDLILDFTDGEDLIGLAEGLTFDDLTLIQENNSTLIYANDELLAILNGVNVADMNQQDFFTVESRV
ncbi:MAG: putative Ig domain-containing protein, partial [Chroococcales cyanobacterium]